MTIYFFVFHCCLETASASAYNFQQPGSAKEKPFDKNLKIFNIFVRFDFQIKIKMLTRISTMFCSIILLQKNVLNICNLLHNHSVIYERAPAVFIHGKSQPQSGFLFAFSDSKTTTSTPKLYFMYIMFIST